MNELQQQSLQGKDARYITNIIDKGFADDEANHLKTQAMLGELLELSRQRIGEKESGAKERYIQENERLYSGIIHSFEFIVDRFCLLSQISKIAEFKYIPALIEVFRDTIKEHEDKLNSSFYEVVSQLLARMTVEQAEHLNGLGEKSLGLKQVNFRVVFRVFMQTYEVFLSCRYNVDFDFWYYFNSQKENNRYDSQAMLVNGLEELSELGKDDVINPINEARLRQECLSICLIGHSYDQNESGADELLSIIPQDMFIGYDDSVRVNQDAYDDMLKLINKQVQGT